MAALEFINLHEVLAKIEAKKKKIEDAPKVAAKMGIIAKNAIQQNCNVQSGNWRDSWKSEVNDLGNFKSELVVYSPGAFSDNGYNYGARQERLNHPGEIGWHQSIPAMTDLWNQAIHGATSSLVSGADEFSMMGGF